MDAGLFWAYLFDMVEVLNLLGICVFLFFSLFSRYIRPFGSESWYNFKLWLRGFYSLSTGKVSPKAVSWERSHPEASAGIVDAGLEWAKQ